MLYAVMLSFLCVRERGVQSVLQRLVRVESQGYQGSVESLSV